jgi:hypothetical protein
MLLGNDVVADRQAKSRPLTGRLGREERLEQLVFDLGLDADAIVSDPDLDGVEEIAGRHRQHRSKFRLGIVALSLGGSVETVAE